MAIVLFSFATVMHGPDGRISGNCPFSAIGASLCPQDTVAIVLHHISAYQSFINVSVNFGTVALIISLLLVPWMTFVVFISPSLLRPLALVGILYNFPPDTSYKREITRWLALHENSPATY